MLRGVVFLTVLYSNNLYKPWRLVIGLLTLATIFTSYELILPKLRPIVFW
jgi:hypothetical protein